MFDCLKSLFGGMERRSTSSQFRSLQGPLTALLLGGQGPTMSGINISPQTALRCSVVFGCVKVLSETVGELPLKLYRKQAPRWRARYRRRSPAALAARRCAK
jgi:phage portal protein BeeE